MLRLSISEKEEICCVSEFKKEREEEEVEVEMELEKEVGEEEEERLSRGPPAPGLRLGEENTSEKEKVRKERRNESKCREKKVKKSK